MKSPLKNEDLSTFDFENLLRVITHIQKCRDREELLATIQERLFPLLQEDSAILQDYAVPKNESAQIGYPGIPKEDHPLIQEFLAREPLLRRLLSPSVQDCGVSPKGGKILEWMAPILCHKIRNLLMEEELFKCKSIAQVLMNSPAGIGLIGPDMRVVTCNKAFQDIFEVLPREPVPHSLTKLLEKEIAQPPAEPDEDGGPKGTEISFFSLPRGNYKVIYYKLEGITPAGTHWLVRIHPSVDPFSKSNLLIQKAGLTWREMEICCLIHDGLGRHEIAERLFISAHTVKTHLKKIHKKLGVNSRTQLVAYLNQHSDDHFEKKISLKKAPQGRFFLNP